MNKYARYMITQQFLNEIMPPLESHKIMGSHLLYDLVNMHFFYKVKKNRPVSKPLSKEEIENQKEIQKQKARQDLQELMSKEPTNIFIKIDQLFTKYILGLISLFYKLTGKKLDL